MPEKLAMLNKLTVIVGRLDRICGRMNHGLAAVALVLAVLVLTTAAVRGPQLVIQEIQAEQLDPAIAGDGQDAAGFSTVAGY
jgi:hypothetical protein